MPRLGKDDTSFTSPGRCLAAAARASPDVPLSLSESMHQSTVYEPAQRLLLFLRARTALDGSGPPVPLTDAELGLGLDDASLRRAVATLESQGRIEVVPSVDGGSIGLLLRPPPSSVGDIA